MTIRLVTFVVPAVALVACAHVARTQSLAQRVEAIGTGAVTFHFAGRPGLCGDGETFMRMGRSYMGSFSDATRSAPCIVGPLQVRLALRDGRVTKIDTWAGPVRERTARALGAVSSAGAASYLMQVASNAQGSVGEEAIFAAVLADSATVWPALLAMVHEPHARDQKVRQNAIFWLARYAAGNVAGHVNDPFQRADEDDGGDGVKAHAVFVLSQLRDGSGIPSLIDIARTNHDPQLRGSALFWLGQSGDPRALALIESLLQ